MEDYTSQSRKATLNLKDLKTKNGLQAYLMADFCTFTGTIMA
jgi:hypothetical protein